ncbi:unnamed protein product [Rangifer tarandus platyrhynchus]|uniref:Uncharacterized protein n=1 Tax=Rangifer tarandus platyrhynchus TaxID=3082113 RepID=A0AC59Y823_RANTA
MGTGALTPGFSRFHRVTLDQDLGSYRPTEGPVCTELVSRGTRVVVEPRLHRADPGENKSQGTSMGQRAEASAGSDPGPVPTVPAGILLINRSVHLRTDSKGLQKPAELSGWCRQATGRHSRDQRRLE